MEPAMSDALRKRTLHYVANCTDADSLRKGIKNARNVGETDVLREARLRLYSVAPEEAPGTLEHAV